MKRLIFISLAISIVFMTASPVFAADQVVVIPLSSSSAVVDTDTDTATEVFNGMNNGDSDPRYAGIAGSQDGSSIHGHVFPVTRACIIKNFTIYISANLLTGDICTITLQKNSVDTAVTKSYSSLTGVGTVETLSGTVTYEPGDTYSIYAQTSGAASSGDFHYAGAFDMEYK